MYVLTLLQLISKISMKSRDGRILCVCHDFTKYLSIENKNRTAEWKLREFTLTIFWQKFRESNICTNEITR